MINQDLIKFIREARKQGFDDSEIRSPLLKQGWPEGELDYAFSYLSPKTSYKNRISVGIDSNVLKIIEKRAKKNMLSVEEQVEDIIRRSAVNFKLSKTNRDEKIDDLLVSVFSRKKTGKKK